MLNYRDNLYVKKGNQVVKIKKGIFFCCAFLLCCFFLELFSLVAITFLKGNANPYSAGLEGAEQFHGLRAEEILHPYIGYVCHPREGDDPASDYGFKDTKLPLQRRSDGKIIIGVFGGSVAMQFSAGGLDALKAELKKDPSFSNKEILILNFGYSGYKQPQQLLALNYILALGGSFDIVINLDGFNEVALPVARNIPDGTFPFFPSEWKWRVARDASDDEEILTRAGIIHNREMQKNEQTFFSLAPLRYSYTAKLIWKCLDRYLARRISENIRKLDRRKTDLENNYTTTGPARHYKDEKDMYQDLVGVWEQCSLQTYKICAANGIKYFHFLQPNQYVPDSKPMGEEERRLAIDDKHIYGIPAKLGYPYLLEAGKELVRKGVNFYDLTKVFANDREPIYIDSCCHVNKQGVSILGRVIGEAIIKKR